MATRADRTVKASPTKEFFIDMLTADIDLAAAIIELVDNSFDGAKKLRRLDRYDGLVIGITTSESDFIIHDNCGGIPIDIARNIVFRFGRPKSAPPPGDFSVGRYGVGMKRALFRVGSWFQVISATETSSFQLTVDVQDWTKDPDHWDFEFDSFSEASPQEAQPGTRIAVTTLHETVRQDFASQHWLKGLADRLSLAFEFPLAKGLAITINGVRLVATQSVISIQENLLEPARGTWQGDGVSVELIAGVGPSNPSEAGWNVYCNDRLLLPRDRSGATGWGEAGIPQYHNQFARFRGYAYLESEDPTRLPMNTTKTGLDLQSKLYRGVRQQMQSLARGVIDFLNVLDSEASSDEAERYLAKLVDEASVKVARDLKQETAPTGSIPGPIGQTVHPFTFTRPAVVAPKYQRIQYDVLRNEAETARGALGVATWKDVGVLTFRYYFDRECRDGQ